jgi:regulator of sigma E protease
LDTNKPALPKPVTDAAVTNSNPNNGTPAAEQPEAPASWIARNGLTVLLTAAAFVAGLYLLNKYSTDWVETLVTIGKVAAGLGLVIFIHELGHFLAAKACNVHVKTFSIGFFGALFGICKIKLGETVYKIGWLPLGGFVRMVGEGDESDDGEEDPRSYKNKPVWQRMIIISAGVFMNLVLAWVCFVFLYETRGIAQQPAIIASVDVGGPAWSKGLLPGDKIVRIGNAESPYFEDLQRQVQTTQPGEPIKLVYERYIDGKAERVETEITPRRIKDEKTLMSATMILAGFSHQTTLLEPDVKGAKLSRPCAPDSPADHATPALAPGDVVVGATDPHNPLQVTPLRHDPRWQNSQEFDFQDLESRLQHLAGKPITLRVQRAGQGTVDVVVPPAFTNSFGLRMKMGAISAIREGSPAAKAGVRVASGDAPGDQLVAVEFSDAAGKRRKYSTSPASDEDVLDPQKLPMQMALWAASKPKDYGVTLTVLRPDGHQGHSPAKIDVTWDKDWPLLDQDYSSSIFVPPVSLAGLGLAYTVESVIDEVEPNSPAAGTELKPGDSISRIEVRTQSDSGKPERKEEFKVAAGEWNSLFSQLQFADKPQVTLTTADGKKATLKLRQDPTWPRVDRGLLFKAEMHLRKADNIADATVWGFERLLNRGSVIYLMLHSLITGKVAPTSIAGPITIGYSAFKMAGRDTYEFIGFMAFISVNLAIVNFLPIPMLDGGHMIFLIYEGIRRKPPSERVRVVLTLIGLVFVIGLMLFTFGIDIIRWFF